MHASTFFKIFPPPTFLVMKHAGLDISDDAIHCLEYTETSRGREIGLYDSVELPKGLIEGGDIKNEKKLGDILSNLEKKHNFSYVKVSLPEEKVYLFQTDVPDTDVRVIRQNIEFKLEENVPLSVADAVFYFDLLPMSVSGGALRATVSVVPRSYIEQYISILRSARMSPVAFEVVPKSIARAIVPPGSDKTLLIIHAMNAKTGIYIVSGGVVSFTSTIGWGVCSSYTSSSEYTDSLSKEINRVHSYWLSHGGPSARIDEIVLVGRDTLRCESNLQNVITGVSVPVHVAEVWRNSLDLNRSVPPVSRDDSLTYAVAAGLALLS